MPGWQHQNPVYVHSCKWVDAEAGVEHLCVIRSDDIDDLWLRVKTVTTMIKAAKAKQTPPATNGMTHTNGQADPSYCAKHHTLMTQKNGRFFHKAGTGADGKAEWCRGQ